MYGPCCPGKPVVKRIRVGNQEVGIAELDRVLDRALVMTSDSEADLRRMMVKELRIFNYIPSEAEAEYSDALWHALVERRAQSSNTLKIEIFGSGCPRCDSIENVVGEALRDLGIVATVEKVTSVDGIVSRGIDGTPALAVDGELVVAGRTPSVDELKRVLRDARRRK